MPVLPPEIREALNDAVDVVDDGGLYADDDVNYESPPAIEDVGQIPGEEEAEAHAHEEERLGDLRVLLQEQFGTPCPVQQEAAAKDLSGTSNTTNRTTAGDAEVGTALYHQVSPPGAQGDSNKHGLWERFDNYDEDDLWPERLFVICVEGVPSWYAPADSFTPRVLLVLCTRVPCGVGNL